MNVELIKRIRDGYKGIPFIPNDLHIMGMKSEKMVSDKN